MHKENIKRFIIGFAVIAIFLALFANRADAATLYITPASYNTTLGSTFTVTIKTDTKGARVNVAEATINFSSDKLEVVSVSPGQTFTMQTPGSPYKSQTKVFFSAGIISPGYKGSAGTLGNITFRAIEVGNANINIASGKVLLNDGNAGDALNGTSGSTISISEPEIKANENIPSPLPEEQQNQLNPNATTTNVPEQPIELQPTQSVLHLSDNVYTTTITITVEDLIHILYILIIIIILLLAAVIYLLVVNSRIKRNRRRQ
ncbi:MAG TPA: cohesin domain-containing protein [Candidatus Paceibacterota bacterium]|jgi:hypothetical protein|nr:cohesin domain-containing protein [Candidatus Paceibacterota bacterium]